MKGKNLGTVYFVWKFVVCHTNSKSKANCFKVCIDYVLTVRFRPSNCKLRKYFKLKLKITCKGHTSHRAVLKGPCNVKLVLFSHGLAPPRKKQHNKSGYNSIFSCQNIELNKKILKNHLPRLNTVLHYCRDSIICTRA